MSIMNINLNSRKKKKRKLKFDIYDYADRFEKLLNDYKILCIKRGGMITPEEELQFDNRIKYFTNTCIKVVIKQLSKDGINITEEELENKRNQFINHYRNVFRSVKNLSIGTSKNLLDTLKSIDPELEELPTRKDIKELLDKDVKEKTDKVSSDTVKDIIEEHETKKVEDAYKYYSEKKDDINKSVSILGKSEGFKLIIDIQKDYIHDTTETFIWVTEKDSKVRCTHRRCHGMRFRFDNPPEIDGIKRLPSEDWNCRCYYGVPKGNEKVMLNYVVSRKDPYCQGKP